MKLINLNDHGSHPLAFRFYDLGRELELLPAAPEQTALAIKLQELLRATQDHLNASLPLDDVQRSILNGTFGVRSAA